MAITLVQSAGVRSSGASFTAAFSGANSSSALLTVFANGTSNAGVSTITDSAGNTWLLAVTSANNTQQVRSQIWYAANAAPSTNTLTITNSIATNQISVSLHEWSGVSTSNPLVSSTGHTSTAASTHTPGSLATDLSSAVFMVNYAFTGTALISTTPANFTAANSTFGTMKSFYRIVTSTTTENPEFVSSGAPLNSANAMAVFSGMDAAAATATLRRRSMTLLGVS